jgi:hypothetical protein
LTTDSIGTYLIADLIVIFFVTEKAQIKVCISVDTSYSFPLARALWMTRKSGEGSRGW